MPIPLWILTGPTASGKTEIGLEITENTGMEIISADSMLVYRGMDIGTEKPSLDRRNKIPHHLIDIADPWEEYSVGQYVKDFDAVAQSLCRQGKQFIVIGGTALYLKALVDGLFEGPPADWEYRNSLKTLAREKGPHYLHTLLGEIDPEAAGKLHFNDQKRIIRALEVFKTTNRRISSFQTQFGHKNPKYDCMLVAIDYDRDALYNRIETRVDRMFDRGLVDEVRGLVSNPRGLSRQASQALGYKEIVDYFLGKYTFSEVSREIKQRTRRFAKRQMTWFRSFSGIHWIHAGRDKDAASLSGQVLQCFLDQKNKG
ncbi:MAG: tRNA (adenosine(37)-N6)-dimethylallyltransferase MiaA [Candidatus Brocadia sp.]|uniref:tRNA dimethylallyltransferase n=1 Tax=Candidatus Brocadia fulgida TaxID=380242 RepID=A0A0M2V1L9_9BACT|nr:MAG: tRNA delta(2)-isopentenylpyrophosphate transferase [Candidatus Brocadia fulgida]MCC6325545.1 tRNA (adenosine(37)-N6)-dimethylallyltransferase MiaA [Candidatus Brocadia sp.]MCE7912395.1 tRNA (adenosine(37)-N6)-dimethylallyltransferase MiaA [Candidatus Brocadia sp. AMX3]MBV6519421.1 tRNA dimethylallyltransferase [Candidatus Brocadia fulgida]MDG5995502.1 tRNA (adenosine(37)-N6)-dimethylallyltransferase MiaA [Candidatus Brocadia sp.]